MADETLPRTAPELTVDVDTVMVDVTAPRATRELAPVASQYTAGTRTMMWSRSGSVQLGLGVDRPGAAPPTSTAFGPTPASRVVLGASIDTSATTQLRWQTPLPATLTHDALQQPQVMEVSLVLKPQDPLASLRRGALMRLELSGQTQLSLRPRGGGRLELKLTSKW